jgi:MFS transporter, putative metabolite:H+ symporter
MLRHRRAITVLGFLCVIVGASLHWPDFVSASSTGFRMSGMPVSPTMVVGMAVIAVGLALAALGQVHPDRISRADIDFTVHVPDERALNAADVRLMLALVFGLVIDVMKPATISFVIPGARQEYHLTTLQITLWPLIALTGTAVGSIAWGMVADWIGRRGGLMLAALLFIATSICGAMPAYGINLGMCFLMGMSAGGMLPLVFALLAEIAPRRHRGLIGVLVGGLGSAGGYLAASGAAALLEPRFGWRLLWLIGLPTGALLVLLARSIPESPRFLIMTGREHEAQRTMRRYGATLTPGPEAGARFKVGQVKSLSGLFRPPYAVHSTGLLLFGFAWGMTNFGFLTWLPTLLRHGSSGAALWNGVLAKSALIAVPGVFFITWLYGRWRTHASIGAIGLLSALTLILTGAVIAYMQNGLLLGIMATLLLIGINGSSAMLLVYSAEIYPTVVRARGSGLVAAATKLGGIVGPVVAALVLVLGGGSELIATLIALPLCFGGLLIWRTGVETRQQSLYDIQSAIQG